MASRLIFGEAIVYLNNQVYFKNLKLPLTEGRDGTCRAVFTLYQENINPTANKYETCKNCRYRADGTDNVEHIMYMYEKLESYFNG